MTAVVGRENELTAITQFLADARERYETLVLEGEAGIGKTTVWREALRLGEKGGFRVLSCRPAQAEAKLAFASLADLVGSVEENVLAQLPEPQKHALDIALLKITPAGRPIAPRAVAAALTSILTPVAEMSPLLIAIDDAQWLDRESAGALSFAARRLHQRSRVALLVATRPEASRASNLAWVEEAYARAAVRFERLVHAVETAGGSS